MTGFKMCFGYYSDLAFVSGTFADLCFLSSSYRSIHTQNAT